MRAVVFDAPGNESVLRVEDVAEPRPTSRQVLIDVEGAALNRGDLMQRMGLYPPPAGASDVLGLECAGQVLECGSEVSEWNVGDRVMALLPGGGYAARAVADAGSVMEVPTGMDLVEAACFPEVFLTVYLNVFEIAGAQAGEWLLVHGGGSGIGTAAIQLAKEAGLKIVITAGSAEKCDRCMTLGADAAINYREQQFGERVREITEGRGVDIVLDSIGAPYLGSNLESLAIEGRLVVIGMMGGMAAELNLADLLMRRLSVIGSTLRARSDAKKADIVQGFLGRFGDAMRRGRIRPVVEKIFPLEEVAEAHRLMAASTHFGKIGLQLTAQT